MEQPTSTSGEGADDQSSEKAAAASGEATTRDGGDSREARADAAPSLLEMALFAPIDAAFAVLRDPGGAATRGRARVEQALRQARAIGELSVRFGARELRRRTEGTVGHETPARSGAAPTPRPDAGPAPDDVIADYDALSASQIVPMLSGLQPAERARVADYEARSRGRQTILRRVEQLDRDGD